MTKKTKILLIGTSEFAARIFDGLISAYYVGPVEKPFPFVIVGVVTAQDKPMGRKQILTHSPVKKWSLEKLPHAPVLQPDKIRNPEWIKKIQKLTPELIILTAYGQIIPKEILDIPKYGALNIHPSLLPKYRGASPIQATILNGDKETGITIILMDEEMDHGPIVSSFGFQVSNPKTTYQELSEKLANVATELLVKTLPDWVEGRIKAKPQEHSKATLCKIIKKEDGKIDWNKSAQEIERQIRAFHQWPGSFAGIQNEKFKIKNHNLKLKILEADVENKNTDNEVGKVFLHENKNLSVQTGNGILILKQLQLEGKKPMSARDFLNGHPEIIGASLQ